MIRTIVVGVDGSGASLAALRWAGELALQLGCRVIAIHSMGLLPIEQDGRILAVDEARSVISERMRSDWCNQIDEMGVNFDCVVVEGTPLNGLLSSCQEAGADLVVIGTRGHGIGEKSIGSTAHKVIELSSIPVVVLPPPTVGSDT